MSFFLSQTLLTGLLSSPLYLPFSFLIPPLFFSPKTLLNFKSIMETFALSLPLLYVQEATTQRGPLQSIESTKEPAHAEKLNKRNTCGGSLGPLNNKSVNSAKNCLAFFELQNCRLFRVVLLFFRHLVEEV